MGIALLTAALLLLSGPPAVVAADGPAPGATAVIGDFGTGGSDEAAVAALVAKARPTAIVTTGDNVYGSDAYPNLVGRFYGPWIERERFFPALGNHDYAEGVEAYSTYFDYLGDLRAYTTLIGPVQYFVLDSEALLGSDRERQAQRSWLARSLPRSHSAWQVVVLHHPPYSSGSVHGSTEALRWPFRAWGADLVLSGHEHQYERIVRGGLTYIVNGSGGKDLYPFGTALAGSRVRYADGYGAVFLSATSTALTGEFWTADGRRIDRFALTRPST